MVCLRGQRVAREGLWFRIEVTEFREREVTYLLDQVYYRFRDALIFVISHQHDITFQEAMLYVVEVPQCAA